MLLALKKRRQKDRRTTQVCEKYPTENLPNPNLVQTFFFFQNITTFSRKNSKRMKKKIPHPFCLFSGAYSSSPVHPTRPSLPRPRPPMGDIQSRPSRVVGCPRSYVTRSAEKAVVNGLFLEVGWFTAPIYLR